MADVFDPSRLDALQLSFVKDTAYGAVTLVLFSAFSWQQWLLAAVHVVSVPWSLFQPRGNRALGSALMVTLAAAIADVVTVLTLTCGLVNCCLKGETAPAFAPSMHVCDPALNGVQGRLVIVTSMTTVGVGAVLSMARAIQIEVVAGGGGWLALAAVYVALRVYQLTWMMQVFMIVPFIVWLISGIGVFLIALVDARRALTETKRVHNHRTAALLYLAAAVDSGLILLPLVDGVIKPELQPAFFAVQSIVATVAVWQSHRYRWVRKPTKAGGAAAPPQPQQQQKQQQKGEGEGGEATQDGDGEKGSKEAGAMRMRSGANNRGMLL